MRKWVVGLLELYRRLQLLVLKMRGHTYESYAEERLISGKSWEEFCDTLKAAGAALNYGAAPRDAFQQAEGYRYLSRLTRAGLEAFVEHADPEFPSLRKVVDETIKLGSDNPDNQYLHATVDGRLEYRIRGTRNTVNYLGFGTHVGRYGQGGGNAPTGYVEASELRIEPDGTFELIVSRRQQPGNWLPMTEETGTLIVRQTFLDRKRETAAELVIEPLDPAAVPAPLTAKKIDDGLRQASTLVAGASLLFSKWATEWKAHQNELPLFDVEKSNNAGGDPNIRYYHSYWNLKADQALVIHARIPECFSWNFQLNNYWLESLDWRRHRIHLSKGSAVLNADGTVTLVVSHVDPGHPNWIETVGHFEGTMTFRWIRAEEHPAPTTEVISVHELSKLQRPAV